MQKGHAMRILILDDDAPFAHMLRGQLERLEPTFSAEAVATAEAARATVKGTTDPFDVFLLDQRLDGSDVDGVTLMGELKQVSPSSDAIILTGYDDQEAGLRAFNADAYRYLTKPFDTRELISILKVLQNDRKARRERDWLHILTEITSQMQGTDDVHALADIIVRGGLRFGFQRARLRLFEQEGREAASDPEMVGTSQAGDPKLTGFKGLKTPFSKLVYSQHAIASGQSNIFHGRDLGPGGNDDFFATQGVPVPQGDWFKIPLVSGGRPIGALTLDNSDEERSFSQQQRNQLTQVLDLFGTQAAAAIERARLHERAKGQAEEATTLSDIGRQVTTQAATGDLETLLDEVRRQVGRLMDATNFMVVLSDRETGVLDFRRQYEETTADGEPEDRHWRATNVGLSGYVIAHNIAVLTDDTESFRKRHGIKRHGPPAQCWLGVPLRVDGQARGALVVQSYHDKSAYTEHHQRLLSLVADQVAGAVHLAYQLEREEELKRQAEALEALKRVLPDLIKESEDVFWHAILTTVTHKEGNSFNRAMLFWYSDDGEHLVGHMAIGHLSDHDARQAWEKDRDAGHSLVQYFNAPHRVMLDPTPLQTLVVGQRWSVGVDGGPCRWVRTHGERLVCQSYELRGCLPDEILFLPDLKYDPKTYNCALLPVGSTKNMLGLLVIDNAFDGEPLRQGDLESLERVLAAAMEVWQQSEETARARRLGERYEAALALQRKIMAQAGSRPLKETLQDLCRGARVLSDANAVVIYPFQASSGRYDYDLVSHVGLEHEQEFRTKNKPRQQGVTFTVLQSGTLVVPDVARSLLSFGGRRLAEHEFLRREDVKALIAAPIRHAVTSEPLGVIYLDYRSPQRFTVQDVALAEHLAAIGATAVSYRREMKRESLDRVVAERNEQQLLRIMQLLNNIQTQALTSDTDQEKMVRAILQNAAEMFERTAKATLALLEWEGEGGQRRQVRRDYHLTPRRRLWQKPTEPSEGVIGQAFLGSVPYTEPNVIACAIRRGAQPIGALLLRKQGQSARFTPAEAEVVERLATVAALALDNMRTRARLEELSRTIGAVVDPGGLQETLLKVVDSARRVAPDIDCITLWYEDAETKKLISGPQWGVTSEQHKEPNASTNRIVEQIMDRRTPLFAQVMERESSLRGDFIHDEGIVSAAAFPLRFGAERRAFGALFFNYRKAHEFNAAERKLLEIFANAAATAIYSAQTADLAERHRKRLETALDVVTRAGASLDRDKVLLGILTALRDAFRRDPSDDMAPYIMLYDERDQVLELPEVAKEFYQPDKPEYQHRVRLSLNGRGITTRTAREALAAGEIVVDNVPNVHKDPDYEEVNSETQTEMCAGLVSEERLLSVLVVKSNRLAAFDQDDKQLFEMAAHQVAIALDRLERAARVERDASVTGAVAWAADIAHDLNSRVGFIRNRAYWLLQREAGLSEQGKEWVQQIDQHATEIADMARDAGSGGSEPRTFVLDELLRNKLDEWRASRAVQVTLDVTTPSSCQVRAHPEQVWRAIRHLLRNAAEAMAEAGSSRREIMVRLLPVGQEQIEVQVQDTGPGVSDEARRHLFREPFSTKAVDVRGRGVGLLLAQWLIESLGGSIYLYPSAPGSRACFGIRLPLVNQEERHD